MLPKITGKRLVKQIMICPHNRILSEEQGKLFKLIGKNFPDKVLSEKSQVQNRNVQNMIHYI